MALTFDLDFQLFLYVISLLMSFGFIEIDSKISKFGQVGPDIYHFIDLRLAIAWRPSWKYANKKLPLGEI